MSKLLLMLRTAIIAALLMSATIGGASVVAQDATQVVGEVQDQAEEVVEDEDDGFDWGLLGLLGLGGLAGLMRRPQPVVHQDLNRTTTRRVGDIDDRGTGASV